MCKISKWKLTQNDKKKIPDCIVNTIKVEDNIHIASVCGSSLSSAITAMFYHQQSQVQYLHLLNTVNIHSSLEEMLSIPEDHVTSLAC
jgi:hypothetical protein